MRIYYNKNLKQLARKLRNDSTKSEIKLWGYLKGKQMYGYDFHRQKPVDCYIVDFFCNKLELAIELDGYSHHFEEIIEKDRIKEDKLNQLGIAVIRFQDDEVMKDIDNVLRAIENYIQEFEKDGHSF
ncbi:endonuclease domain-containing protein [Candidatus Amoebophilus asiaticus]|nr:endonuclease domain-containing protein [Candidatus Amoebophilus asiaticus]